MKQAYQKVTFLSLILLAFAIQVSSQTLTAYNDAVQTGPLQKVRINVTKNDSIPCSTYTLSIVSAPSASQGTATLDGDFLTFIPAASATGQTVNITYRIECNGLGTSSQATVAITVAQTNLPVNIIQTDQYCIDEMPNNVTFGIQQKYTIAAPSTSGNQNRHEGFHIPLVGDLNGDNKPEIISLGVNGTGLSTVGRWINITDGQTGNNILSFDLTSPPLSYAGTTQFQLRNEPYHSSPSNLAIADMDGDGIGEIVVAESGSNGRLYALKPAINAGNQITGLTKMWDAEYGFKAPLTGLSYQQFGQVTPIIVDINGDGTPEVIAYNKIYNGVTGKLLMAWNGAAATPTASSLAAGTGLYSYRPAASALDNATKANNIKARAMVGRRPANTRFADDYHAVPAIVDIDNDGVMEIITGTRIHKLNLTYLGNNGEPGDHTQNTYTTIEGPASVTLPTGTTQTNTYYLSDGFTRVADIDGDNKLDIIVANNATGNNVSLNVLITVWDYETQTVKAAGSFWTVGTAGSFGIPFIGDINKKEDGWDGNAYAKRLPEICITTGRVYQDRNTANGGRSGIPFHSLADFSNHRFNNTPDKDGQIIAITYDASQANMEDRLRLSWAMEHFDDSDNTGITMFDFNNDGAFDLCYRDRSTIRVISPALDTTDYLRNGYTGNAVLFSETIYSQTGYEAPAIADVNMDGSADIVVAGSNVASYFADFIRVFEHKTGDPKWAPCPPVWNQALYNPLHINEDLTVPAKPISTLTTYTDGNGKTIQPYNGAWIQQPIVRLGEDYVPIYRHPDAVLVYMMVERTSTGKADVTITIRNDGLASISAATPIDFYITDPNAPNPDAKLFSDNRPIGVDIFANEKVTLHYELSYDPAGKFIHCRLVDDGVSFAATGFSDCNLTNNEGFSAIIRANDDSFSTNRDVEGRFDILANDSPIGLPILTIIENPKYGVASITPDSKLLYTADTDSPSRDTLCYTLHCEYGGRVLATIDTAYVYFFLKTATLPDNISPAGCYIDRPAADWSIKEATLSHNVLIQNYGPLAVGDIDADGVIEMIGYKEDTRSSNNYESAGLKIFTYNDAINSVMLKREFLFATSGGSTSATFGSMAIARYNDVGYIVAPGTDKYLYAYNINGGRIWKSDQQYNTNGAGTIVGIADFNNDDIPEVYTGNQIFSLLNGKILCNGGTTNSSGVLQSTTGHSTLAVDMDGDDILELVAGTNIYSVSITNHNGTAGNTISLKPEMQLTQALPAEATNDGATQVVDIDDDGTLEVVVMSQNTTSRRTVVYVWKPQANNLSYIMGSYLVPAYNVTHYSIPMLGNIDNDTYPEIVFITNGTTTNVSTSASYYRMYALKLNPNAAAGSQLSKKWELSHTDGSGSTGATLFDFNQDGKNEIVYRDQTALRIIDGSNDPDANPSDIKATFNNILSGTLREYPVIADIDVDGQAEIVITGWDNVPRTINGMPASNQNGYLRIFKSDGSAWAPARKVWNQYAYNAVNVNENLTIPTHQFNITSTFSGTDGMAGTTDDVRPYNGFLQQQTILNSSGTPLWLAPQATFDGNITYTWRNDNNTLEIEVGVKNIGDADFIAPFYATAYKNAIGTANKLATGSCTTNIAPGSTEIITIVVPDINQKMPISSIHIRLNDNDGTHWVQTQCAYDHNESQKTLAGIPVALNDTTYVRTNHLAVVDIAGNDTYSCALGDLSVTIEPSTAINGTASINPLSKELSYQSNVSFGSIDRIYYKIKCNDSNDAAIAIAYMVIYKPVMVEVVGTGTANENGLVPAQLKFSFMDGVAHSKPVKVTYEIDATSTASPSSYALSATPYTVTIPQGQLQVLLTLTPKQNYIVEGSRDVKFKIIAVEEGE